VKLDDPILVRIPPILALLALFSLTYAPLPFVSLPLCPLSFLPPIYYLFYFKKKSMKSREIEGGQWGI